MIFNPQLEGYKIQMASAEKKRKQAMDANLSKTMSPKEKEDALNQPERILNSIGGFSSGTMKPGQFVPDGEGGKRFIPRYRDISFQ